MAWTVCSHGNPELWVQLTSPNILQGFKTKDPGYFQANLEGDDPTATIARQIGTQPHRAWAKALLSPGEYHPRIQRQAAAYSAPGPNCFYPPMKDLYRTAFESSTSAARNLFVRLEPIFRIVEPEERNLEVFGHELRHLLILACTEVESGLKAVLKANNIDPLPRKDGRPREGYNVSDYLRLVRPMRLDSWQTELAGFSGMSFQPFGTSGASVPKWWTAYNKVKHDRENQLHLATLRNVLDALAAVVVVVSAQFGVHAFTAVGMYVPPTTGAPRWEPSEFYVPPFVPDGYPVWTPADLKL